MSLKDIREQYPFVRKVLFESWMWGKVYNYANHNFVEEDKKWEEYGTTMGIV